MQKQLFQKTSLWLWCLAAALNLNAQTCPDDVIINVTGYTCQSGSYDVHFTIRTSQAVQYLKRYYFTPSSGILSPACAVPPPDPCFTTQNFATVCGCDGNSYPNLSSIPCAGLSSVGTSQACDGTYNAAYTITGVTAGEDVLLDILIEIEDDPFFLSGNTQTCSYFKVISAPSGPIQPGTITGATNLCAGSTSSYSIGNVPLATGYQWVAPSGASIISGQGSKNITVQWENVSGNLCVQALNDCGSSTSRCLSVTAIPNISVSGVVANGLSGSFQLNGGLPQQNGSNYGTVIMTLQGNPGVTATLSTAPFTHGETVNFVCPQAGAYTVAVTDANGCSGTASVTVNDNGGGNNGPGLPAGDCWTWQNPLPQGNTLNDVFFVDEQTGWAVGDFGTILTTHNGGINWHAQYPQMTVELEAVHFNDLEKGWAAGSNGSIFTTINGGVTWVLQNSGITNHLFSIYCISELKGWAVGQGGVILKTIDGGSSWSGQYFGTANKTLYSICFIDELTGWIVGEDGIIIKTNNGGETWIQQTSGTTNNLRSVHFIDAMSGWAVGSNWPSGSPIILRTTSGGATWVAQNAGTTGVLSSVHCIDSQTGWAVGSSGKILKTTNGGTNWVLQNSDPLNQLESVHFINSQVGWAVGAGGIIVKTVDEGFSWNKQILGTTDDIESVYFVNSTSGWTVGKEGTILNTNDQGTNWTLQSSGTNRWLYSVYFTDIQLGWTVGGQGTILVTNNGGVTWGPQNSGTLRSLQSICFVNTQIGWVAGEGGIILKTVNGGATWVPQNSGTSSWLWSIFFVDIQNGWAAGEGGIILKTVNGGTTWTALNSAISESLFSIYFVNSQIGWTVGSNGIILKTVNGGTSWATLNSGTSSWLNSIYFIDNQVGWVVGDGNIILKTTTGGYTWTMLNSGSINDHNSVYFANQFIGWSVGDWGNIFLYTPSIPTCISSIPLHTQTDVPTTTSISWPEAVGCEDGYRLQISTTPGGADLLDTTILGIVTSFQPTNPLPEGATIYVRISPFNDLGPATACPEFSFTTAGCTLIPQASFNQTVQNTSITFNNMTTDADSYLWDFGDGSTSTEADPVHQYAAADIYIVTLIAVNGCASDTLIRAVSTAPKADFFVEPQSGCASLVVQMNNASSPNAVSFQWQFPGGTPASSNQLNPVVIYSIEGQYSATLIAFNAVGNDTTVYTNLITVDNLPTSDFNATANGLTATFTNTVTDASTYLWDFGDGTTQTYPNPINPVLHQYAAAGNYQVCLTTTNDCGSDQACQQLTVQSACPPTAQFFVEDRCITGPNTYTLRFSASCTGYTNISSVVSSVGTPDVLPPPVDEGEITGIPFNVPVNVTVNLDANYQLEAVTCPYTHTFSAFSGTQQSVSSDNGTAFCAGSGATLSVPAVPGATFQWRLNGASIPGANANSYYAETAGTYDVTWTESGSCTNYSSDITLSLLPAPSPSINAIEGCTGGSLSLQESSGTANQWSWAGPAGYAATGNPATRNNLLPVHAGVYTVTATNAQGCTATNTVNVMVNPALSVMIETNGPACGTENVTLSVNNGVSWNWQGPDNFTSTEQNPLLSGIGAAQTGLYHVTVTDANGCTGTDNYQLNVTELDIDLTTSEVNCLFNLELDVTGNATGPLLYDWADLPGNDDPEDRIGISEGNYDITITDQSSGCAFDFAININGSGSPLQLSSTELPATSCSIPNGSIQLTVTGSVGAPTFSWSSGQMTQNLSNVSAGAYTVTVTSGNGCTATLSATVPGGNPPTLTAVANNATACVPPNGAINLGIQNGSSPFEFSWSNGAMVEDPSGLAPGTYTVTVTDAADCVATASAIVSGPTGFHVTATPSAAASCLTPNGSVTLSLNGVTGSPTFSWNTSATTQNLQNIPPGVYTVTVTNGNGCTATAQATVSGPTSFTASAVPTASSSCSAANGSISVSLNGSPVAPTGFLWNTGATTQNLQNLQAGTYTVIVTDAAGCTATAQATVGGPTSFSAGAVPTASSSCAAPNGSISVSLTGSPVAPTGFLWNTGATTQNLQNLQAGTYTVTVTDAAGCTASAQTTVSGPMTFTASATFSPATSCTVPNGSVTLELAGAAAAPTSYLWNTGAISQNLQNLPPGTYSVTVTDAVGCTATAQATVTGPTPLTFNIGVTTATSCTLANGSLNLNVQSGAPPYAFLWNTGATSEDLSNIPPGDYSVTVTDANLCTATQTTTVQNSSTTTLSSSRSESICPGDSVALGGIFYKTPGVYQQTLLSWLGCDSVATLNLSWVSPGNFVAENDSFFVFNTLDESLLDVLFNDVLGSNDYQLNIINQPQNGEATVKDNEALRYEIGQEGFAGIEVIRYTLCSSVCTSICDTAVALVIVTEDAGETFKKNSSNVLTPSIQDDINDLFDPIFVMEKLGYPINEANSSLDIFNRWGDLIVSKSQTDVRWNGMSNSKPVPQGTYYYIFRADIGQAKPVVVVGAITVLEGKG